MAKSYPKDYYICSRCGCIHAPPKLMWDNVKHCHIRPNFMSCPVCGASASRFSFNFEKVEVNLAHKNREKEIKV